MGSHQVDLKFANLVACDANVGQFAYTRSDGIRNAIFRDEVVDYGAGAIDGLAGLGMEQNSATITCDFANRFECEVFSVYV
jgi:hypothetical protein